MTGHRAARDDGYTLIETVVVALVIGILLAIGIPVFMGQVTKTHDIAAQALARDGLQVEMGYHLENGQYTSSRANLEDFESSLDWNQRHNPPGTIRARTRRATQTTDVCVFTQSESGTWFAIYHSETQTLYGKPDRVRSCTPRNARDWSPDGW